MKRIPASTTFLLFALIWSSGCTGTREAVIHPLVGTWQYTLDSPQGVYRGDLTISGSEAGGFIGVISSNAEPDGTALRNIMFDDGTLAFEFDSDQAGKLIADVKVDGDGFAGTLKAPAYDLNMPFEATKVPPAN